MTGWLVGLIVATLFLLPSRAKARERLAELMDSPRALMKDGAIADGPMRDGSMREGGLHEGCLHDGLRHRGLIPDGARAPLPAEPDAPTTESVSSGGARTPGSALVTKLGRLFRRGRRCTTASDLVAIVSQLAGLARAGVSRPTALAYVAANGGDDDIGTALRRAAARAGRGEPVACTLAEVPALHSLAATWRVADLTGAPVAAALERLAVTVADDLDAQGAIAAALAGPTATVRVLLALPLVGVGLGYALGVNVFEVLLGRPLGWACLAIGLGATCLGWWWSRRLLATATR